MSRLNRFVVRNALSAVAALGIVGCAAETATPARSTGATQAPVPGIAATTPARGAAAGAAAPAVGVPAATPGAPGIGAQTPAARPPAAMGAPLPAAPVPGSMVTPPAAAAPPVATTPPAAAPSAPGAPWDPKANLDASGNLIAPAAGAGFQWTTPTFTLQPGQELFKCYHVAVPGTAEFPVGEWDSQMSSGSHHFILYRTPGDAAADGTLSDAGCTQGFGGTAWLYTGGSPRGHLKFPDNVAMTLAAKERITFDLHYINAGASPIQARVSLNANKVLSEKFQKADAQISFNIGIAVPPHGTQTVQGDCTPVAGAKYFLMQTHSHKYTTMAVVNRKMANGQLGEVLSMSTDWEQPEVRLWPAEPFLTFQAGEKFHYSCSYKNDTNNTITVGVSAELNEMCMAEAYFFPASATTPQCN